MNPNTQPLRSPAAQERHNVMVEDVAKELVRKGFQLKADAIGWPDGEPPVLGENFKPDIMAFKDFAVHFMEIETCSSFRSTQTAHQLQVFSMKGKTTVIVPARCGEGKTASHPVLFMREALRDWGLQGVKIGTWDPATGQVELPRELLA